jgi:hypothetical protein
LFSPMINITSMVVMKSSLHLVSKWEQMYQTTRVMLANKRQLHKHTYFLQ